MRIKTTLTVAAMMLLSVTCSSCEVHPDLTIQPRECIRKAHEQRINCSSSCHPKSDEDDIDCEKKCKSDLESQLKDC